MSNELAAYIQGLAFASVGWSIMMEHPVNIIAIFVGLVLVSLGYWIEKH